MNEEDQRKDIEKRAVLISVAVMLYIIAIATVIIGSVIGQHMHNEDIGAQIGVIGMFVLAAVATGLIVYANISVPKKIEHDDSASDQKTTGASQNQDPRHASSGDGFSVFNSLMKLYWLIITVVYLGISFITMKWYITWLIWLIAAAVEQGIKIIHTLCKNR